MRETVNDLVEFESTYSNIKNILKRKDLNISDLYDLDLELHRINNKLDSIDDTVVHNSLTVLKQEIESVLNNYSDKDIDKLIELNNPSKSSNIPERKKFKNLTRELYLNSYGIDMGNTLYRYSSHTDGLPQMFKIVCLEVLVASSFGLFSMFIHLNPQLKQPTLFKIHIIAMAICVIITIYLMVKLFKICFKGFLCPKKVDVNNRIETAQSMIVSLPSMTHLKKDITAGKLKGRNLLDTYVQAEIAYTEQQ